MKNPFKILDNNNQLDPVELDKAINRLYDAADDSKLVKPKTAMVANQRLITTDIVTGINCTFKSSGAGKANAKITWIGVDKFVRYEVECRVTESETSETYTLLREAASTTCSIEALPTGYKIQIRVRGITQGLSRSQWSLPANFDVYVDSEKLLPPTGLTVSKYWKWVLAKVDRIARTEDKNFKCFEWHVGLDENFVPDETYEKTNILLNESFEGYDGTLVTDWTHNGLTGTYSTAAKKGINPKELASAKLTISNYATQNLAQTVAVDPNGTYVIEGFVMAFDVGSVGKKAKVSVTDFTGTGTPGLVSPWNTDYVERAVIQANWKPFTLRIQVGSTTTGLTVRLGASENCTIYYDRVTMRKINSTFIKRSHGNSIIFHLDRDPNTVQFIKVRKINHDGSASDYCESVSENEGVRGDDGIPPPIPTGLAKVSVQHTGWKWLRRADLQLECDKAGLSTVSDFDGILVQWRRTGTTIWFSKKHFLNDLYDTGTKYRFEIENLGVDKTYDVRICSFDKSNNKSAFTSTITPTCDRDTTSVADPTSARAVYGSEVDGNYYWRAAAVTVWVTESYIVTNQIDRIEIRARRQGNTYWKFNKTVKLDDCVLGDFFGTPAYYFEFDRLFQDTIYEYQVRCTAWWGEKSVWSTITTFTTPSESPQSFVGQSVTSKIFSRSIGLRGRIQSWYANLEFTAPTGIAHKYQVKIAKQVTRNGVTDWLIHNHTIGYNGSAGELTDLVIPIHGKPASDTVGQLSGYKFNIRAGYLGKWGLPKSSGWDNDPTTWEEIYIGYAGEDTDPSAPTVTWEQIWFRWVSVKPCEDGWDYPSNFSHFEIHATTTEVVSSANLDGVGQVSSKSRIGNYHRWDRKPHTYYIPNLVYNGTNKVFVRFIDNVKLWAVPILWKYSAGVPTPTAASLTGNATIGTASVEDDPSGSDFAIKQRAVAAFGGDVIYTACARLSQAVSANDSDTDLYIEKTAGETCPFTAGDIVILGTAGTNFGTDGYDVFNYSDQKELIRVTATTDAGVWGSNWKLTVVRDFNEKRTANTNDVSRAGQILVKVGEYQAGGTAKYFRYAWYDAINSQFKIVRAKVVDATPDTCEFSTEATFGAVGDDGSAIRLNYGSDIKMKCDSVYDPSRIVFNRTISGTPTDIASLTYGYSSSQDVVLFQKISTFSAPVNLKIDAWDTINIYANRAAGANWIKLIIDDDDSFVDTITIDHILLANTSGDTGSYIWLLSTSGKIYIDCEETTYTSSDLAIEITTVSGRILISGDDDVFIGDTGITLGSLFQTDGHHWYVGEGSGVPRGSFYGNEIGWSQATAAQNTWYAVSDADIQDGHGGMVLMTHDGSGKLTTLVAGRYLICYGITLESSIANKHIQCGLRIAGFMGNDGIQHVDAPNTGEYTLASTAIYDLPASTTVELAVRTTDTGAPTIGVDHVNLTMVHIGGT